MVRITTATLVVFLVGLSMLAGSAQATNGYFSHGYGVQSKGMGGVGVAFPKNSLAAATNPAGMVHLGKRIDFSLGLFHPVREYTVTGNPSMTPGSFGLTPGTIESDSKWFVIPSLGMNFMIDDVSSFGVSLYGNGGMNTNYDFNVFQSTAPTGVDLAQLFGAFTYSRKLNEKHSVGLTGIFAYQRFKAEGLAAFGMFSSDATALTDNDYANGMGFGARVGYMGEWIKDVTVGGSFQTKMYMSEFDEYAGLYAEQGDFDIPANWTVGVAVKTSKTLTLAADVQTIYYSKIKSIANPMNPNIMMNPLGHEEGAGFGWQDMTTFKFGLEWEGIADMPIRLGYSYGEQPIPEKEVMFNILAPGVIEQHITFGLTRECCNNRSLSLAIMYGLSNSVTGVNPMDPVQNIELKMNQWEFVVGYGF